MPEALIGLGQLALAAKDPSTEAGHIDGSRSAVAAVAARSAAVLGPAPRLLVVIFPRSSRGAEPLPTITISGWGFGGGTTHALVLEDISRGQLWRTEVVATSDNAIELNFAS